MLTARHSSSASSPGLRPGCIAGPSNTLHCPPSPAVPVSEDASTPQPLAGSLGSSLPPCPPTSSATWMTLLPRLLSGPLHSTRHTPASRESFLRCRLPTPTSLLCFRTFRSYPGPRRSLQQLRPSDSALQTPGPHLPLLPTSHFPLWHTSSGTPLQAVPGRRWHLCPHLHCALSSLHRSCLCSSLKAAQAANMRQLSPPDPTPRPRGSPAPSARNFMTGLPDLLWGGCKGRNSWTTARGKGGPLASSPLSRWKARAPSGGHSAAQQSRQGWLRSCPVLHPQTSAHL